MRTLSQAGTLLAPLALTILGTGCIQIDLAGLLRPPELQEYIVEDRNAEAKVALITISGMMTEEEGGLLTAERNIMALTRDQLEKAALDDDVKAVVLRVDSPGGGVYPSLVVNREITRFRSRTKKPVIAYAANIAASGGYMAAVAADEIVADPASLTGSIGVIAFIPEVTGLLEWAKLEVHVVKAGEEKDVGSPFTDFTDEDRALINDIIQYYYRLFKETVSEGRPKLDVSKVATGAVFTAPEALELGLVDAVGDVRDAYSRAAQRAGLSAATTNLVVYRRPDEYHGSIYVTRNDTADAPAVRASFDLNAKSGLSGPKFMYLWNLQR